MLSWVGGGRTTATLLAAIVAVDALSFALVLPLLPVLLDASGTATWLIAVIFAAFSICQVVAAPVLGRWGDRYGRRRVLLLSQVGTLVGFVVLAFADGRAEWILISRVIDGATAGNLAIVFAVLCDLYPESRRTAAFARINAAAAVGAVGGLMGAAWLAGDGLRELALIATGCAALTVLLGAVAAFPRQGPALSSMPLGLAWRRLPVLRPALGGIVLSQIVMTAVMASGGLLLHRSAGLAAGTAMGVLLGGLVGGAVLQAGLGGLAESRWGRRSLLLGAWSGLAIGVVVLAVTLSVQGVSVVLLTAVVAWLAACVLTSLSVTVTELSARSDLGAGATMGLSSAAGAVGQLIGPAAAIVAVGRGVGVFTGLVLATAAIGLFVSVREGAR